MWTMASTDAVQVAQEMKGSQNRFKFSWPIVWSFWNRY